LLIFCAIHMTEKWPLFFAYDDRKVAVLVLDVPWRQHFFFSRKPKFFVSQLPMGHIKITFLIIFLTGCLSYLPSKGPVTK
jgi:hypothetical protein